jgi:hypothetical protein
MEFDNSFEVPLPPAQAWAVLMDIQRIAPCMPGAELTEVVDPQTYRGKISVRLGPVALAFAGLVKLEDIDNTNYSARVKAQGSDAKGRGGANAAATFRLEPAGAGSKVLVHTDLTLSGSVAQYGRGVGMIQATAAQIIGQFANNLKAQLAQQSPSPPVSQRKPRGPEPLPPSDSGNPLPAFITRARNIATPAPAAGPPPAKPISGLSLIARVIWDRIAGVFTRRSRG